MTGPVRLWSPAGSYTGAASGHEHRQAVGRSVVPDPVSPTPCDAFEFAAQRAATNQVLTRPSQVA